MAGRGSAAAILEQLDWLADDVRPLDWKGPADRPYTRFGAGDDPDLPLFARFERVASRRAAHLAILDPQAPLTYARLWDGACGLAEAIGARTAPGQLVALLLPAGPMFPLAVLACLAAGRPFLALDPAHPADWRAGVLADAGPALVLAPAPLETPSGAQLLLLDRFPAAASAGWRPAERGLDEPACVLFTSGSTGRPKGVVNSQRALLQRAAQSIDAAHIDGFDRLLTLGSPGAIVGVRDILTAFLAGAAVRLVDPGAAGGREIVDILREDVISILFAFPALLRSVAVASPGPAPQTLRLVRFGGDVTTWGDVERLRAWLRPGALIQSIYAATEAPVMQWFVDESCRGENARIPIGYPLAGARLGVDRESGELIVASPCVALGRWTEGRFQPDPPLDAGSPPSRSFRTGDVVRLRPDGLLDLVGRKDRQVKIRGVRVELDGVEAALRRHPFVRDAAALARRGADGSATLIAEVSAREGAPADLLGELKALMRGSPAAMRPARLYLVDEVARLPSSKLDLRALAATDEARATAERAAGAGAPSAPTVGDGVAQAAAEVWSSILGAPPRGPGDDFFEAGGDSLKALMFAVELERALGLELPATLLEEAPAFAALCAALRGRPIRGWAPLVLLKRGEGAAPVFIVHGLGGSVGELIPMARAMTWPGPVFGLQARGLAARQPPHYSVEAMAGAYLAAIKARMPVGPYHLAGYSFGGLVVFEMARRLAEAGDEVGLVGLFDAMIRPVAWRRSARLALGVVGEELRRLLRRAAPALTGPPLLLPSAPAGVLRTILAHKAASAGYRPGVYPGELTLFTPLERDAGLPSPESQWRPHARTVTSVQLPGRHLTMLAPPNAAIAADALTRGLMASLRPEPTPPPSPPPGR